MTHVGIDALAEHAEGTLPEDEAALVVEHLRECRSCMAAYADAVRYRAAWLADSEAFRLHREDRPLIAEVADGGRLRAKTRREGHRGFAVLATATAIAAVWIAVGVPMNATPSLGFLLTPAMREATVRSSAEGLVLPGAEHEADRPAPELRGGGASISSRLDSEVRHAIGVYEAGAPGADDCARAVGALLAQGEIEAARNYASESLERHPQAVPLLVFAADASFRSGDPTQAHTLLRRAAWRAPHDPLVALDLGIVLRQMGRTEEARRMFTRATKNAPAPLAHRARLELAATR